jgi:pimeloyl-ACP methyl ester carboxylesterase
MARFCRLCQHELIMLQLIQLPNGIDLAFQDVGGGPAVFLIHGHPLDHTMWQPQVEFLAPRYRVIIPDLRGYGTTPLPAGKSVTLLDDFAEDILTLADHLDIERFAIVGLSLGGQITLETWRQAPERIRALVLADTFASLDTPEQRQTRLDTADRFDREGFGNFAIETLHKMMTPANAQAFPAVAEHIIRMCNGSNPHGAAAALRGRTIRRDYIPLLGQITVPSLIIVGREDAFTPVPLSEEMHSGIPGSRLKIIEGSGHMTNLERPEEFNSILASFLQTPSNSPVDGGTTRAYA